MKAKEYERFVLIRDLGTKFLEDFDASMEAFSEEEQVHVCELLIETASRYQETRITKVFTNPALTQYLKHTGTNPQYFLTGN